MEKYTELYDVTESAVIGFSKESEQKSFDEYSKRLDKY